MNRIKLQAGDIEADQPLAWRVFDNDGRMVLAAGRSFQSADQVEAVLCRGLFREPTEDELNAGAVLGFGSVLNPFELVEEGTAALDAGLRSVIAADGKPVDAWITPLLDRILELSNSHADAVIGSLLLVDSRPYSLAHPWMCATLCDLIAQSIEMPTDERRSLVAAALTSNVGMFKIQDCLADQQAPLSEEQRRIVHLHPIVSAKLLMAAGVADQRWLQITLCHHERLDGSGYPRKLAGSAIGKGAKLLGLADIYAAMLLPRAYRDGLHAKKALLEIFTQRGSQIDAELAGVFIKEVGIYPPGVLVKLENGETGVVVRRNPLHPGKPMVSSLRNIMGKAFQRPLLRDTGAAKAYAVASVLPRQELPFGLPAIWGR